MGSTVEKEGPIHLFNLARQACVRLRKTPMFLVD
jgi:hypothetical protein